jgi:hypothetical protein
MKFGSRHLGKVTSQYSRRQFHLSLLRSLASYGRGGTWWRKWECLKIMGGQGSHNKPIDCGASGAYAPGHDDEEEMWRTIMTVYRCGRVFVCDHMCNVNIVACVCSSPEVQTVGMWSVSDPNCGLELPGQNCSLELFWWLNCVTVKIAGLYCGLLTFKNHASFI